MRGDVPSVLYQVSSMLSIQWRQEITLWIILSDAIEPSWLSTKKLLLMYYFFQKTVPQKASFPKYISPMNLIMRIVILEFQIQGITGSICCFCSYFIFWEVIFDKLSETWSMKLVVNISQNKKHWKWGGPYCHAFSCTSSVVASATERFSCCRSEVIIYFYLVGGWVLKARFRS